MEIASIKEILKRTDVSFLEKAEFASAAIGITREDDKLKPDFVKAIQWDSLTQDELKHLFMLDFGYEKFPKEVVSRIHWHEMTIYDIVRLMVAKSKNGHDFSWQRELVVKTVIDFSKYSQKTLLWMMRKIKKETWGAHVWKMWLKIIETGKFSKEEILELLPEQHTTSYEFDVLRTCEVLFARKDVDKAYGLDLLKKGVKMPYSKKYSTGNELYGSDRENASKVNRSIAVALMGSGLLNDDEIFLIGMQYGASYKIVEVLGEKLTLKQLADIVAKFGLVPEQSNVPPKEWQMFLKQLKRFEKIESKEQKEELMKIGSQVSHYILWSIIFYSYLKPNDVTLEKAEIAAMLSETKDARMYAMLLKTGHISLDVNFVLQFQKFIEKTKPQERNAHRKDGSGIYDFWEQCSKTFDWSSLDKKQAIDFCKKINDYRMWNKVIKNYEFNFHELHELIKLGAPESLITVS